MFTFLLISPFLYPFILLYIGAGKGVEGDSSDADGEGRAGEDVSAMGVRHCCDALRE